MLRSETERVLSYSVTLYLTPSFTRASFPNSSPSWSVQTTPCVCVCVCGGGGGGGGLLTTTSQLFTFLKQITHMHTHTG